MLSRSVRLLRTANRSLVPTATQLAPLAVARSFQHSAFLAKESDDKRYTKPEYKSHKPVDYAELKKITDAPDDVSLSLPRSVMTEIDRLASQRVLIIGNLQPA